MCPKKNSHVPRFKSRVARLLKTGHDHGESNGYQKYPKWRPKVPQERGGGCITHGGPGDGGMRLEGGGSQGARGTGRPEGPGDGGLRLECAMGGKK